MVSSVQSFAPTAKSDPRPAILQKYLPKTRYEEENGINPNVYKHKKPNPYVKEERPACVDLLTGELVYKDTRKPTACYIA